jgi:hypothetical protein
VVARRPDRALPVSASRRPPTTERGRVAPHSRRPTRASELTSRPHPRKWRPERGRSPLPGGTRTRAVSGQTGRCRI